MPWMVTEFAVLAVRSFTMSVHANQARRREALQTLRSRGKYNLADAGPLERRQRFRPLLEQLERREMPALVINPTFAANITSDPNAATIMATINQAIRGLRKFLFG